MIFRIENSINRTFDSPAVEVESDSDLEFLYDALDNEMYIEGGDVIPVGTTITITRID